ncbi:MAG: type II toxin-antitoxin system VapC family toxin [Acidobacteriota bacterium]
MEALYLETSALLAWLLGEPEAEEVRCLVDSAGTVVTSVLTLLEANRSLLRAEHREELKAAEREKLGGVLRKVQAGWFVMEISGDVRRRAARAFPREPVRTLDAIHLSTALLFAGAYDDFGVLSFDHRIVSNLEPLGLRRV